VSCDQTCMNVCAPRLRTYFVDVDAVRPAHAHNHGLRLPGVCGGLYLGFVMRFKFHPPT
jgi:hypothetical protein